MTGNVPLVRASTGTRTWAAPSVTVTRSSLPSGKTSLLLDRRTLTCNGSSARLVMVMGSSVVRPARVMVRAGDRVDRVAELVELLVDGGEVRRAGLRREVRGGETWSSWSSWPAVGLVGATIEP